MKSASDRSYSVGLGAWISTDLTRNKKEIDQVVSYAKQYYGRANITHLNIGTEAVFRGDINVS